MFKYFRTKSKNETVRYYVSSGKYYHDVTFEPVLVNTSDLIPISKKLYETRICNESEWDNF